MKGIANPIGLKMRLSLTLDELICLIDVLNPDNIPGRLTLIARMGADMYTVVRHHWSRRSEKIVGEGRLKVADPMHGNADQGKHRFQNASRRRHHGRSAWFL